MFFYADNGSDCYIDKQVDSKGIYQNKQQQKKIFRSTNSSFLETGGKMIDMGADVGSVDVPMSEKCNKNLKLRRRVRR